MDDLSLQEAEDLCTELISGRRSTDEIKETLTLLQAKGETAVEIAGFSKAIVKHAQKIPFTGPTTDLCGTGGSLHERFNVSTSVAFIVSNFDIKLAKHGNKGSKKANGSFDLLEHLGIPIDLGEAHISECLEELNLAFIFARKAHPAMKNVAEARREMAGRTIFNLAGPLSNPTSVMSQIVGTADPTVQKNLVEAGRLLDRENIAVVYGEPGVDELSISGTSTIYQYSAGQYKIFEWSPIEIGLSLERYESMPVGLVENNAKVFLKLMENEDLAGINDMVCINAGFALFCFGISASIKEGYLEAKKVIKYGLMKQKFEEYRDITRRMMDLTPAAV